MNACWADIWSVNGFTNALVAKQNNSPKNIEIGSAGSAFRQMASNKSVKHKPYISNRYTLVDFDLDEKKNGKNEEKISRFRWSFHW